MQKISKTGQGETFKQIQKERLIAAGPNTDLVQKRGTSTIKAKDIPDVPQPSVKGQKNNHTKRHFNSDPLISFF